MKKTLFSVLAALALCLAAPTASAEEDVYTLLGPDGQAVTQYMGECEAGDEYISGDNLHYRVVSVDPQAKTAQLELLGVLINMYDGRLNLTVQVLEQIKKFFPGKLFSTPIPRSVRISEAPSHGMSISDYDKYSKGALAYMSVTDELIARAQRKDISNGKK